MKSPIDNVKEVGEKSFQDYLDWMEDNDKAEASMRAARIDLEQFGAWFRVTNGEDVTPAAVTGLDLREWRAYLLRDHKASSVNRKLATVRTWLRWAQDTGQIETAPKVRNIKGAEPEIVVPDRNQVNRLVRRAERRSPQDACLVALLKHGARISEVCAARLGHFAWTGRGGTWTVIGKGNVRRDIPVNSEGRRHILRWIEQRAILELDHDYLLIAEKTGRPLGTQGARLRVRKLSNDELRPHRMRHWTLTQLSKTSPLPAVMALAGHRRATTTQKYLHSTPAELRAGMERLAEEK